MPIKLWCLLLLCAGALGAIPAPEEVRRDYVSSEARLFDRNGRLIHERRVDSKVRRLPWISLDQMSPALRAAVVLAEDKRFSGHGGVDWSALVSAAWGRLFSAGARGASTITMQLAGILDEGLRPKGRRRGLWLKWKQMEAAWAIEKKWSKDQILEAYLNLVSFRGELRGIASASRGLFGKDPHGLSTEEAVVLAALIRSPNATPDPVTKRACTLGKRWEKDFNCEGLADPVRAAARPYRISPAVALAPHVAQRLLAKGTASAVSTLDLGVQKSALEALSRQLTELRARNVRDGAVLVIDNESGEVLAYVGNAGDLSSGRYVDAVQAPRQAGSTLKPFLYGLAMEKRLLTAASLLEDSSLDVALSPGVYRPENYDKQFRGLVTLRSALASSLNVPAVRTLLLMEPQDFVDKLRETGIGNLREGTYYGPSLALGSADVTLWEMTNAYRTLANGGAWSPLRLTTGDGREEGRRAFSPQVAFLLGDILSDRESRALTFGLENPLGTRFWSAVKTGTSKDMRDNWCIGYSRRYTVGVWVGNFSGEPMWNVTGISGAAPVWISVMSYLHARLASEGPKPPEGVVRREVSIPALRARRQEYFLEGTETARIERVARRKQTKITYPVEGEIVALDPDIPPDQQRLFFAAKDAGPEMHWVLDGKRYARGPDAAAWEPRPGRHRIVLVDERAHPIDTVDFEVRGRN